MKTTFLLIEPKFRIVQITKVEDVNVLLVNREAILIGYYGIE